MQAGLSVRQLVEDLGPAFVRLAVDGPAADRPLTGVCLYDPTAPDEIEPGCVVLGIGVAPGSALDGFGRRAATAGANAVAVKGLTGPPECPVPVLEVNAGAPWMHVAAVLRERLLDHARSQVRHTSESDDLFALANAISLIVRAPVTIEDRSSAVLAWSAGQEETDEARVATILGRAVDDRWLGTLRARGVFRQLHTSPGPVYVDPVAPGMLPRVAVAVRAGTDVLGYVWAAVSGPLSEPQESDLMRLVPLAAVHLINARTSTTHARRKRREAVAALLGGGVIAPEAAVDLRLGTGPLCVLAAGARDAGTPADTDACAAAALQRFADRLDLYLGAVHTGAVTSPGDSEVYAVLTWPRRQPDEALASSQALARDFLSRASVEGEYVIAVGGPVLSPARLVTARAQADAMLRVLRDEPAGRAVGTLEDTVLPLLLRQLTDSSAALGLPETTGSLRRLEERDGPDGVLVETLSAYVRASCVAEAAAEALHVHVNTIRYRLRRIRQLSGLDFADAEAMLLLHLQLRMRVLRRRDGIDAHDKPVARS